MTPAGSLTTLRNFYGTTPLGGAHYLGTLFKITPAGSLITLHSLSGSPGEGVSPVAALVQGSDGNFYGTTALGGAHYWGTVFKFSLSAPAPLL
jgi:uncharacterized repeat protein (TIGR03803 family)